MITITVQSVYTDGKKEKTIYDINVGDEAITGLDEETAGKLVEQLKKVINN